MQGRGHDPGRPAFDLAILVDLRQGDKAQLGIAGGDELERLGDVLPFDQLGLGGFGQFQLVQHLGGGQAVGSGFRVGDGQVLELVLLQHFAVGVDIAGRGRPQGQGADGVGEARARNNGLFLLELGRGAVVGSQEYLERRPVLDLRVELAGGAIGGDQLVAGVFFEVLGNGLDRRCEVRCDRDLDFIGPGIVEGEQAGQGGGSQVGRADTHEDSSLGVIVIA